MVPLISSLCFYKQNYPLIGNKYLPENRFIESKEDLYFGVNFKYYTSINKDNSNSITLEKKQLFPQKGSGYNYFPHNDYLFMEEELLSLCIQILTLHQHL